MPSNGRLSEYYPGSTYSNYDNVCTAIVINFRRNVNLTAHALCIALSLFICQSVYDVSMDSLGC